MAFDPVRDAILNSPERLTYNDPFDEFGEELGDFKVPDSHAGLGGHGSEGRISNSPERVTAAAEVAITPGGLEPPPTPGTGQSSSILSEPRPPFPNRQSSIFSLLSPEPPESSSRPGSSSAGYSYDFPGQKYEEPEGEAESFHGEPARDRLNGLKQAESQRDADGYENGSVKVEHDAKFTTIESKPQAEPRKRGRMYNPHGRMNGPAPTSLYTPYTASEYEYYTNPINCRNPLRKGGRGAAHGLAGLRSPILDGRGSDFKGKGKEREGSQIPDDIDVTPGYSEPSPLHPSLIPDPVYRRRPDPPSRNGSAGNLSPAKKRKRPSVSEVTTSTEGVTVAAHYNKRQNISREERTFSPIIGLKSFNNWVKTVLINKFSRYRPDEPAPLSNGGYNPRTRRDRLKVLDLGCGKGGDLMKWQKAGLLEYIGVDIAEISVSQARDRWKGLRGAKFDAAFYAMDAFSNPLSVIVPQPTLTDPLFDVVSMQFCMHYAFQSVSKARMMLENVSRYLRPGGTFLGTIPDSEQILGRLRDLPEETEQLTFGNAVYSITFDDRSKFPAFGHRYRFFLQDAVEDVPEYVVQWDSFESLAAEYQLKPVYHATFHEVFNNERERPEFSELLLRMKVITAEGESELTEEQWEAANIYVAFAFVKQG